MDTYCTTSFPVILKNLSTIRSDMVLRVIRSDMVFRVNRVLIQNTHFYWPSLWTALPYEMSSLIFPKKYKKKKMSAAVFISTVTHLCLVSYKRDISKQAGLGGSVGCAVRLATRRSIPAEVGNILSWRLIMKYFLWSFSPFHWFKKGSCQLLAKECAQYW